MTFQKMGGKGDQVSEEDVWIFKMSVMQMYTGWEGRISDKIFVDMTCSMLL